MASLARISVSLVKEINAENYAVYLASTVTQAGLGLAAFLIVAAEQRSGGGTRAGPVYIKGKTAYTNLYSQINEGLADAKLKEAEGLGAITVMVQSRTDLQSHL